MSEDIELVLLPPKERTEVTKEDIAKAYIEIINLLNSQEN